MQEQQPPLTAISRLVIVLVVLLVAGGLAFHGITWDHAERLWRNLLARPSDVMSFRFFIQPLMATIVAVVDGMRDTRAHRAPFLWALVHEPEARSARLREGLNSTSRTVFLSVAIDAIYQILQFRMFYPAEALAVAFLLAVVPYVVIRGPVSRLARAWRREARAS